MEIPMSKYKVGSIVTGSVTGIEKYGVFINLDDYYSGLIHISEISHNFVKNINDFVDLGEIIRVKVIEVDEDLFHVKLSIKDINVNLYLINDKLGIPGFSNKSTNGVHNSKEHELELQ